MIIFNTKHVPVYCDMPGNYYWGERIYVNLQVTTGGA